jgi:hypothetical protein
MERPIGNYAEVNELAIIVAEYCDLCLYWLRHV